MIGDRTDIISKHVVLVEGGDEVCILPMLLSLGRRDGDIQYNNVEGQSGFTVFTDHDNTIQFSGVGGRSGFSRITPLLSKLTERNNIQLRSLGLVCDSDDNPAKSLELLQDALKKAGLPIPESHAGFAGQNPAVGIFVIPDGVTPGSLDTMCRKSVADDARTKCVDGYLQCLEDLGMPPKDCDKSFIYAYSVAVGQRGERAGALARHGKLNLDHKIFCPLIRFLEGLLRY